MYFIAKCDTASFPINKALGKKRIIYCNRPTLRKCSRNPQTTASIRLKSRLAEKSGGKINKQPDGQTDWKVQKYISRIGINYVGYKFHANFGHAPPTICDDCRQWLSYGIPYDAPRLWKPNRRLGTKSLTDWRTIGRADMRTDGHHQTL